MCDTLLDRGTRAHATIRKSCWQLFWFWNYRLLKLTRKLATFTLLRPITQWIQNRLCWYFVAWCYFSRQTCCTKQSEFMLLGLGKIRSKLAKSKVPRWKSNVQALLYQKFGQVMVQWLWTINVAIKQILRMASPHVPRLCWSKNKWAINAQQATKQLAAGRMMT